ncbi:DUF1642 domain-containing protein [Listeria monocytogenes]|nr:DUF1642 domain-containing protein [Listeria monocytogenes]EHG1775351.1 DUF1642 domain-containing protein [Listeria monocytogenes]
MRFKEGDKVEFIYRNKKSVGVINGVYPGTQEVSIKQSDSPVDLLFSNKFIVKIEEQERLVVSQCVADWYEDNKDKLDYSIWKYIRNWEYHEEDGFFNFMNDNDSKSIETLNKMRNGYEVEKEPLYYVKLQISKRNEATDELEVINMCLLLNIRSRETCISGNYRWVDKMKRTDWRTNLTEAEIKGMPGGDIYWQFAVLVDEADGEDNE